MTNKTSTTVGDLRARTALCDSDTIVLIKVIDEENDRAFIAEAVDCYPDIVDFEDKWINTFKIISCRIYNDE